jgi:6-phosphogluconolactonase/glucosamine-6-phosphate isomerase/deaminase
MQKDGNLVLRDGTGEKIWASNSNRPHFDKYCLSVGDDGHVAINGPSGEIWPHEMHKHDEL